MKCIVSFLLVVSLLSCPAVAESIVHIGDTNPADEGWKVLSGIPGGPDYELEPSWRIATVGHGRWGPVEELTDAHFSGEWSLVIRAKWNAGAMAQQRVTIFDGLRGKSTAFTWDDQGIYYYQAGLGDTLIPDTTPDGQFHYMAVTMDPLMNNSMVFNYDGQTVAILPPDKQNDIDVGRFLLYWGDNNGAPGLSDMQYSYVSLSNEVVPEPTTWAMCLIGLAVGAFWWRRKRK